MQLSNRAIRNLLTALAILLAVGAAACGDDGGETVESTSFDDEQIVVDYADQVVIPTYELLDTRAGELQTAVDALAGDPTDANLEAARDAWVSTREPWEQSEASLFGPVDSNGYDPALDSWPVNRSDLEQVLAGDDTIDQAYVEGLDASLKGFHTIEFLLFGDGGTKTAADLSDRELDYLTATTADLKRTTGLLATSWTDGVDGQSAYREVFTTAGADGNQAYPSLSAAGQEITTGMITILDEVANGKIADPFDNRDTTLVESQFSYNSLTDFKNNIIGVQNAYLGKADAAGTSGKGLTAFVAAQDADLDARVKAEIQAAIDALDAVPEPFRDAITDDAGRAKIEEAITAISTVQATVEQDVQPLVTGQ
ncbi:peptidase M75 [Persicimonas caeni]|uniref:Peptidase M75 n=1 Tax=Persicimonas caeni TaxID=2292766 RepID=A0A4Y6PTI3_PERCE|nr:imelysin family protein [Persicimonas caeni]QDG51543.1 peptidase M75 [Persicimonas caeni]QED32764.1 peptidase M75 [Persicimonas caeni]